MANEPRQSSNWGELWKQLTRRQRRQVIGTVAAVVFLVPLLSWWVSVKDTIFRDRGPARITNSTADHPSGSETGVRRDRPGANRPHDPDGSSEVSARANPVRTAPRTGTPLYFDREVAPPPGQPTSAELFTRALAEAAAQQERADQERRYQGLMRAVENGRRCATCGGSGSYRYVDAGGVLRLQTCPACNGLGRNY